MTRTASGPYARNMGIVVARDDDGGPLLVLPFRPHLLGRPGFVHGGAIAGLLEVAMLVLAEEVLGTVTPAAATIDFMRSGYPRDSYAVARILRRGNRIANIEAHAWQDDRARPIAAARMNMMLG